MEHTLKTRLIAGVCVLLFWSNLHAAQVLLKTDAGPGQTRSINTELGVQNTMNTELYGKTTTLEGNVNQGVNTTSNPVFNSLSTTSGNLSAAGVQVVKQWTSGLSYTVGNTAVVHGGVIYVCIASHLAAAETEPGVGAAASSAWATVTAGGGAATINDLTDVDTTGKASGKVLKFDALGNLIVGDDEIGAAGTGDITGVTAGTGLAGGGDTGAVTLSLATAISDAVTANTAKISFDATSSTKLSGIAEGATVNSADATLLDRANHTGTQAAATISDFDIEVANNATVTANTAKISYTPATPGNIGGTTPAEGHFTALTAQSFDYGTPAPGTTGEMYVFEDPNNGGSSTGWKAPSQLLTDIIYTLPGTDGTAGQVMATNGLQVLSWVDSGAGTETDPVFAAWTKDYNDLINTPTIPVDTDDQTAAEVTVNTTNFAINLSATDTTVQAALDTLDDMISDGANTASVLQQTFISAEILVADTGSKTKIPTALAFTTADIGCDASDTLGVSIYSSATVNGVYSLVGSIALTATDAVNAVDISAWANASAGHWLRIDLTGTPAAAKECTIAIGGNEL